MGMAARDLVARPGSRVSQAEVGAPARAARAGQAWAFPGGAALLAKRAAVE